MTSMFKAVEKIALLSLFQMTNQQPSKVDTRIAQALISDGAFVATGLAGSSSLDEQISKLMRFFWFTDGDKTQVRDQKLSTIQSK